MPPPGRMKLSELNPHLICVLCGGYLIDATTISRCLHSFCRTCIVQYLKTNNYYCPVCATLIHKKWPLQELRDDNVLQDIVYKVVPGLFHAEMKRRRDFYTTDGQGSSTQPDIDFRRTEGKRRIINPDQNISLALHFKEPRTEKSDGTKETHEPGIDVRYFLCPAMMPLSHLKKLLRLKFALEDQFKIDFATKDEILRDHFTLLDVAYIISWNGKDVMSLAYTVYKNSSKRRKRIKSEDSIRCNNDDSGIEDVNNSFESSPPSTNSSRLNDSGHGVDSDVSRLSNKTSESLKSPCVKSSQSKPREPIHSTPIVAEHKQTDKHITVETETSTVTISEISIIDVVDTSESRNISSVSEGHSDVSNEDSSEPAKRDVVIVKDKEPPRNEKEIDANPITVDKNRVTKRLDSDKQESTTTGNNVEEKPKDSKPEQVPLIDSKTETGICDKKQKKEAEKLTVNDQSLAPFASSITPPSSASLVSSSSSVSSALSVSSSSSISSASPRSSTSIVSAAAKISSASSSLSSASPVSSDKNKKAGERKRPSAKPAVKLASETLSSPKPALKEVYVYDSHSGAMDLSAKTKISQASTSRRSEEQPEVLFKDYDDEVKIDKLDETVNRIISEEDPEESEERIQASKTYMDLLRLKPLVVNIPTSMNPPSQSSPMNLSMPKSKTKQSGIASTSHSNLGAVAKPPIEVPQVRTFFKHRPFKTKPYQPTITFQNNHDNGMDFSPKKPKLDPLIIKSKKGDIPKFLPYTFPNPPKKGNSNSTGYPTERKRHTFEGRPYTIPSSQTSKSGKLDKVIFKTKANKSDSKHHSVKTDKSRREDETGRRQDGDKGKNKPCHASCSGHSVPSRPEKLVVRLSKEKDSESYTATIS